MAAEEPQEPTRITDRRRVGRTPEEMDRLTRIAAEESAKARGEDLSQGLPQEQTSRLQAQVEAAEADEAHNAQQVAEFPEYATILMVKVRMDGSIQVISNPLDMVHFLTEDSASVLREAVITDWLSIASQLQMLGQTNFATNQIMNALATQAQRAQMQHAGAVHPVTGRPV